MKRGLSFIALTVLAAPLALGQELNRPAADEKKGTEARADEMGFYSPAEVKWKDGPGSLPAGAKFAVLEAPGTSGHRCSPNSGRAPAPAACARLPRG